MTYTRENVWELGGEWADPILWYARGVSAMKARALAEPISWRFYGAMHGIDPTLWKALGYLSASDPLPTPAQQNTFWNQCQHGSWYFLPWHRGYLLAFEANIRAEVVKLGGPADWALPYWNYFKAGQSALPTPFASADWPDGTGTNPLFVSQRYGPQNDGKVYVVLTQVNLKALADPVFTGVASGGSPGFGGVDTGFAHAGQTHGGLETQPHDWVHGLVGGSDPNNPQSPGLMSDPDTAGLDPIFWLHHANIDRLWEVWRQSPATHVDPTAANWLQGPTSTGERIFAMPMPDGTTWNYTPTDVADYAKLNYQYDDVSPVASSPPGRRHRLGLTAEAGPESAEVLMADSQPNVKTETVELVGASAAAVSLQGSGVSASVVLDPTVLPKVSASLRLFASAPASAPTPDPDRVFLNLENVRGVSDATAFQVYVGLPDGANPANHPELLAGSVALFGVRKASRADDEHGGQGLTFVLEITDIIDALHLNNALNIASLPIRLVPVSPVPAVAQVTIGRISVFRQGR